MESLDEIRAILQHGRTNMPCLKRHGVIKALHPDACCCVFLLNVIEWSQQFHFSLPGTQVGGPGRCHCGKESTETTRPNICREIN